MSTTTLALETTTAIVAPHGHLDAVTGPTLRRQIIGAGRHAVRVVVDLANVHEMDAAGLAAIVGPRRQLRRDGVEVEIRGANAPSVRRTLAVTRFTQLFDLTEDAA